MMMALTIAGMFHHNVYAFSCRSCIPFGTWYGCGAKGLHRVQPFGRMGMKLDLARVGSGAGSGCWLCKRFGA